MTGGTRSNISLSGERGLSEGIKRHGSMHEGLSDSSKTHSSTESPSQRRRINSTPTSSVVSSTTAAPSASNNIAESSPFDAVLAAASIMPAGNSFHDASTTTTTSSSSITSSSPIGAATAISSRSSQFISSKQPSSGTSNRTNPKVPVKIAPLRQSQDSVFGAHSQSLLEAMASQEDMRNFLDSQSFSQLLSASSASEQRTATLEMPKVIHRNLMSPSTSRGIATNSTSNSTSTPPPPPSSSSSNPTGRSRSRSCSSSNNDAAKGSKADKGLRHFSALVCAKVEEKGSTTYNEVADELVQELAVNKALADGEDTSHVEVKACDHKNIRRRVYDALNVLMAIGIIRKEKKDICWLGIPDGVAMERERLSNSIQGLQSRLNEKRQTLVDLVQRLAALKSLIARNYALAEQQQQQQRSLSAEEDRLQLPFILINAPRECHVHCEMLEDRSQYFFEFDAPFLINEDVELLRLMGLGCTPSDDSPDPQMHQRDMMAVLAEWLPSDTLMCYQQAQLLLLDSADMNSSFANVATHSTDMQAASMFYHAQNNSNHWGLAAACSSSSNNNNNMMSLGPNALISSHHGSIKPGMHPFYDLEHHPSGTSATVALTSDTLSPAIGGLAAFDLNCSEDIAPPSTPRITHADSLITFTPTHPGSSVMRPFSQSKLRQPAASTILAADSQPTAMHSASWGLSQLPDGNPTMHSKSTKDVLFMDSQISHLQAADDDDDAFS